ncbi:MAG: sodium-coupled transporter [Alphaproteobacteria bacterium]|nr:sodium-coupled transporter [Alphaproteobacteria bacterium]
MLEDFNITFTFLVLAAVFAAFIRERVGPHIVALTGMGALLLTGAISTGDMLNVFSNSAPITIACMFVISAALDRTGVVDAMGRFLLRMSGKSDIQGIAALIAIVVIVSAFMNNTPVVIILTPVVITLAQKLKHYPSKYLIPLSYAAIMGGTCTLIGTSTNILVDGIAREYGQPAFGMFEITLPGLCFVVAGMLYMGLVGRFLLPDRMPPKDEIEDPAQRKRFVAEAVITADSPLIGKTLNEVQFTDSESYEIIDLVRRERGNRLGMSDSITALLSNIRKTADEELVKPKRVSPLRDIPLEAGDRLVFKADRDQLIELKKHIGVEFDPERTHLSESLPARSVIVVEGLISQGSDMISKKVRDLRLRRRYGCFIIGLHRMDKNITGDIGNTVLRENDTLFLEGPEDELTKLFEIEQILSASQIRQRDLDTRRAPIAIITILAVVALSALNIMPIAGLSFLGALVVILSGCVTAERAYKTIDWRILLLIFGMLGVGAAMENTGAMELVVKHTVELVEPLGPIVILAIVYLLTSILTEIVTNNAVAIVMTPIVIGLATTLGLDPRPFIVAVMFAASASFATPIGYQTNTFVYAAGGYKFKDFLKIGVPLNIIMLIVAMIVIPLFWSF